VTLDSEVHSDVMTAVSEGESDCLHLSIVNKWRRPCVGETRRLHDGYCCSGSSVAQVQRQTETVADPVSSIQIRLHLQC